MRDELADLDQWIAEVRRKLPILKARLRVMSSDTRPSRELRNELALFESILESHAHTTREGLDPADLLPLLDTLHHGIQHCTQFAVDAGDEPATQGCLAALRDIDERLCKLRVLQ